MKNKIDFLDWLKKIEIEKINNEYKKKIEYFNHLKNNCIKNNIEINTFELNNLKEKYSKKEKLEKDESNIVEWINDLYDIYYFFGNNNEFVNKVWKYKILYFIYAGFIYIREYFREKTYLTKDESNKENYFDFFNNEKEINWYAFKNGPITNHYEYLGSDKNIEINFSNFEKEEIKILEIFYFGLKNFSIDTLIDESHHTSPWKDNWERERNSKFWILIKKNEIIDFFKNNPPFYVKNFS